MSREKREELAAYAEELELDIIGVTESWCNSEIDDGELGLSGYTLYRKDRNELRAGRGGGVLLYVKSSVISCAYEELNSAANESVWCKIKANDGKEMCIGVCYRSQKITEEECRSMFEVIERASQMQVIIMGDFNYPGINWDKMESDSSGERFLETCQDCIVYQHVRKSTRGVTRHNRPEQKRPVISAPSKPPRTKSPKSKTPRHNRPRQIVIMR